MCYVTIYQHSFCSFLTWFTLCELGRKYCIHTCWSQMFLILMSDFLSTALAGVVPAWSELPQPLWFWLDQYGGRHEYDHRGPQWPGEKGVPHLVPQVRARGHWAQPTPAFPGLRYQLWGPGRVFSTECDRQWTEWENMEGHLCPSRRRSIPLQRQHKQPAEVARLSWRRDRLIKMFDGR